MTHSRRLIVSIFFLASLVLGTAAAPAVAAPAPDGTDAPFAVERRERVAPGVTHLVVRGGDSVAHVAVVAPDAPVQLRTVLAGDRVGGPLERTSAMCQRIECVVAVNADFTLPGTEVPVGGVVRDGHLLKSPSASHHQLLVGRDGALSAEQMTLSGRLVSTDLSEVAVGAVNSERRSGDSVVYTPTYGRRTGTNRFGTELVVDVVEPEGALELGATALVEMLRLRVGRGNSVIPAGGAVVSAHGEAGDALAAMWHRARQGSAGRRALLRIEANPDAFQSVGGTPILLRDGRRWYDPARTDFVQGHHPRTVMAWDDGGRMWMITVDGRQTGHSEGLSIPGATALAEWLGATDALNLDGGGSTTFVVGGAVVNSPSDQLVQRGGVWQIAKDVLPGDSVRGSVERPVTTALALVPKDGAALKMADPLKAGRLDLPEPVRLTPPTEVDPASNPFDTLPALVVPRASSPPDPRAVALAVMALAVAAILWGIVHARRRPHLTDAA